MTEQDNSDETQDDMASFKVVYRGKGPDEGHMRVADLAPALLAIGILCDEASAILYPKGPRSHVQISAIREGSFEVALDVVQPFLQQVANLFQAAPSFADQILKLIGISSVKDAADLTATVGNLLVLLHVLGGRKPESIETIGINTVQINIGNDAIKARKEVVELYKRDVVRSAIQDIAAATKLDSVDQIDFVQAGEVVASILKREAVFYDFNSESEVVFRSKPMRADLGILRVSFSPQYKWNVSFQGQTIFASIEDSDFYDNIDRYSFSKETTLNVTMMEIKREVDGEPAGIAYEIIKVHSVSSPGELDFP